MIDLTLEQHVQLLIEEWDIPDARKNMERRANVRWLLRNISANNSDRDNLSHVKTCLRAILDNRRDINE